MKSFHPHNSITPDIRPAGNKAVPLFALVTELRDPRSSVNKPIWTYRLNVCYHP